MKPLPRPTIMTVSPCKTVSPHGSCDFRNFHIVRKDSGKGEQEKILIHSSISNSWGFSIFLSCSSLRTHEDFLFFSCWSLRCLGWKMGMPCFLLQASFSIAGQLIKKPGLVVESTPHVLLLQDTHKSPGQVVGCLDLKALRVCWAWFPLQASISQSAGQWWLGNHKVFSSPSPLLLDKVGWAGNRKCARYSSLFKTAPLIYSWPADWESGDHAGSSVLSKIPQWLEGLERNASVVYFQLWPSSSQAIAVSTKCHEIPFGIWKINPTNFLNSFVGFYRNRFIFPTCPPFCVEVIIHAQITALYVDFFCWGWLYHWFQIVPSNNITCFFWKLKKYYVIFGVCVCFF